MGYADERSTKATASTKPTPGSAATSEAGPAGMKTEIVLRIPQIQTDFVVATVNATNLAELEEQLSIAFTELSEKIPEQFLLDDLEEGL
jgi:hypothetical protein